MLEKLWRKEKASTLFVGMLIDTALMENNTEVPYKTKNRAMIEQSHSWAHYLQ